MLLALTRNHFLLFFLLVLCSGLEGQRQKADVRFAVQKEDHYNQFRSDEINHLDLLHAFDAAGVGIHKFNLGKFDQAYQLYFFADTYENGKLIKTDTFFAETNEYIYFEAGEQDYKVDFFDQLKIITLQEGNVSKLRIHTYAFNLKREVALKQWDDGQFYNWRAYGNAHWKLNEKIPMLVYASSWKDKRYGFQRFCGVVVLDDEEKDTRELLNNSPAYAVLSYKVVPLD